jgi:CDP-glycerol glycerophosphotransferase (TagB/SpsB family)
VPDVNDLLPAVDILITDYSSIYFDFLLLDRPMIFSCHDLEEYIRDRGLMMDYDLNTPGPKVRTAEQFLEQLELTLRGDDPARGLRGKLREKFHRFPDAHSAERIAQRIAGEL